MDGAFLLARKSFESDLWRKRPSTWWKIWCYIVGHVQHSDFKELKRGQGWFNFTQLCLEKSVGVDVTIHMVEHFLFYAKRAEMIATERAVRGVIVTVRHYDIYQDMNTYTSGDYSGGLGGIKAEDKRKTSGTYIYKNDKNDKNVKKNISMGPETKISILDNLSFFEELSGTFPNHDVSGEIEKMKDYILSTGKAYKNYKAFARYWLRNAKTTRARIIKL